MPWRSAVARVGHGAVLGLVGTVAVVGGQHAADIAETLVVGGSRYGRADPLADVHLFAPT